MTRARSHHAEGMPPATFSPPSTTAHHGHAASETQSLRLRAICLRTGRVSPWCLSDSTPARLALRRGKYIRVTVFLASVLFLVGISTRFPIRAARYGLVAVGAGLLILSPVQLAQLPATP